MVRSKELHVPVRLISSTKKRLYRHVKKLKNGCWVWTGYTIRDGHGMISFDHRMVYAHRLSWALSRGPVPAGVLTLHSCDNPPCIRPSHLFLGSDQDNADDRELKGRGNQPVGERNSHAKLTEARVLRIRRLLEKLEPKELAIRFDVTIGTIYHIRDRRTWRWL